MPVSYLPQTPVEFFPRRRWYKKPKFYVPLLVALVGLVGFGIYFWYLVTVLTAEPARSISRSLNKWSRPA